MEYMNAGVLYFVGEHFVGLKLYFFIIFTIFYLTYLPLTI